MPSFNSGSVGRGKVMQRIVITSDSAGGVDRHPISPKDSHGSGSRTTSQVVDISRVIALRHQRENR